MHNWELEEFLNEQSSHSLADTSLSFGQVTIANAKKDMGKLPSRMNVLNVTVLYT